MHILVLKKYAYLFVCESEKIDVKSIKLKKREDVAGIYYEYYTEPPKDDFENCRCMNYFIEGGEISSMPLCGEEWLPLEKRLDVWALIMRLKELHRKLFGGGGGAPQ